MIDYIPCIIVAIGFPLLLALVFSAIYYVNNHRTYEKPELDSFLEFYYKNRLQEQETEYIKRIEKLKEENKELKTQLKLQEHTTNVLYNILKECLNNSLSENQEIIRELEELEQKNE